jgi:cytidyltransferase-like protein
MTATSQRTILTYGTFDLFHPGHVALLRRAKELGTRLVVGLSTDEFNAVKGKKSVMSYECHPAKSRKACANQMLSASMYDPN